MRRTQYVIAGFAGIGALLPASVAASADNRSAPEFWEMDSI